MRFRTIAQAMLVSALAPIVSACSEEQPDFVELAPIFAARCPEIAFANRDATDGRRNGFYHAVPDAQILSFGETDAVLRHFESIGYDPHGLRDAERQVPRVLLAKMPSDLPEIGEADIRKRLFLAAMLPAALHVNEEIREIRRRLAAIQACEAKGFVPSGSVKSWLDGLGERYRAKPNATALLDQIGEIPPSLTLAQAAVESGWGTSDPAQRSNSLFGQYANYEDPEEEDAKPVWRLASYDSILDAVRSYAHNLNSHRAYRSFRARRLAMTKADQPLDSLKLAEKLLSYSTRRGEYVRYVQLVIRSNRLKTFDTADLARDSRVVLASAD